MKWVLKDAQEFDGHNNSNAPPSVSCTGGHLPDWANPSRPCLSPAFHYECNNDSDKQEFEKALETIAVSFSST